MLKLDDQDIKRGVHLFTHLALAANRGDAAGISYAGFLAYIHGVDEFHEVAGRNYLPSDSNTAIRIAWEVTSAAGGRKEITRATHTILAGMDTFIWSARPPYDRPARAWLNVQVCSGIQARNFGNCRGWRNCPSRFRNAPTVAKP